MKKQIPCVLLFGVALLIYVLIELSSKPTARAEGGGGAAVSSNGDVNGSGAIDVSDPVYLLNWLFLGGPGPLPFASGDRLPDTGQSQCVDLDGQPVPCRFCVGQPRPCEGFLEPSLTQEDAMQHTGCPNDAGRFTVNGDGTVTDNCAGLQWLQETAATPDDDRDGHPDPVTWFRALEFCQDLVFAGHDDWRLPNVRELQSIVDYGRFEPALAPQFLLLGNPSAEGPELYFYWTSTTSPSPALAGRAMAVSFDYGEVVSRAKVDVNQRLRVRAVRDNDSIAGNGAVAGNGDVNGSGAVDISDSSYLLNWLFLGGPGPLPFAIGGRLPDTGQSQCFDDGEQQVPCRLCLGQPRPCEGFVEPYLTQQDAMQRTGCPNDASRFTVNGDGTVTDNCTGLQWLQDTLATPDEDRDGHPDPVTWNLALGFCQDLVFAGHDDWRLPNVRELQSIVDYGRFEPALAPQFRLRGNPSATNTDEYYFYWTSTTGLYVNVHIASERKALAVSFYSGSALAMTKTGFRCRVRAVRGGG